MMTMVDLWLAGLGASTPAGASEEQLDTIEGTLGVRLPRDYRRLMRRADGGDQSFGESWIVLWCVNDLVDSNHGYAVAELAPGCTYFGSNGAGEGYAWDWRQQCGSLYAVMDFTNQGPASAVPCGNTLEEFLAILHAGIPFGA
jgi:hypothetical protein